MRKFSCTNRARSLVTFCAGILVHKTRQVRYGVGMVLSCFVREVSRTKLAKTMKSDALAIVARANCDRRERFGYYRLTAQFLESPTWSPGTDFRPCSARIRSLRYGPICARRCAPKPQKLATVRRNKKCLVENYAARPGLRPSGVSISLVLLGVE